LSTDNAVQPIRLFLDVRDGALADRLAALLADVAGLQLVGSRQAADAVVLLSLDTAPSGGSDISLTLRESQVLGLLAEGAPNKVIAHRLGISIHTVKFHVRSVLDKLDAVGRTDAVAHAVRLGVIDL
jgi:DNA-binding CsgD family transcriptional regulator